MDEKKKYKYIHMYLYKDGNKYVKKVLHKKCCKCCKFKITKHYINIKGKELKTCDKCREYFKKYAEQKKIELKEKELELKKREDESPYNSAKRFINEILQYREDHKDNDSDDWRLKDKVSATELYEKYDEWRWDNYGEHQTHNKFGRSISDLLPNKSRTSKGNFYTF